MTEGGSASWWEPHRAEPGRGWAEDPPGWARDESTHSILLCVSRSRKCGVVVAQGLQPGKSAAAQRGDPGQHCATSSSQRAADGGTGTPGLEKSLGVADLTIRLLKFTRPAARNLNQHPHTGISDPTSLGVGRPAPHLETPETQGGPSHIWMRS